MSAVHWAMVAWRSGLCGAETTRETARTAIRLVTCPYCQNIIDNYLSKRIVSLEAVAAKAATP